MTRTRTRKLILRGVWRSACVLILGCAQIFGVDEACVAGGNDCDPCIDYCNAVSSSCSETPQYDDTRPTECLTLCQHFPRNGAAVGNTLECRRAQVDMSSGEPINCKAAGRGGEDTCGSNCESYCSLMKALCPASYDDFDPESIDPATDEKACMNVCGRLTDLHSYNPAVDSMNRVDLDGATVQCRLWHLGVAAIQLEAHGTDDGHCLHAIGKTECGPTPPPGP